MLAAVQKGDSKELAELMRQDPGFKVNIDQEASGWTLLHYACRESSRSAVIPLLLAHPGIDVNVKNRYGCTPFLYACANGRTSCVHEMLKDSRVKVNEPSSDGRTPLWWAARYGHVDVIKLWIAFGREMDLGKYVDFTDAIAAGNNHGRTAVVALLERFKNDAAKTRHAMRVDLDWHDDLAAEMFALVVFISDGLLQTKATGVKVEAKRTRFFNIARNLPLELQMVLCYRVVGSAKEIIPGKESEVAFKELARSLLSSSFFTSSS